MLKIFSIIILIFSLVSSSIAADAPLPTLPEVKKPAPSTDQGTVKQTPSFFDKIKEFIWPSPKQSEQNPADKLKKEDVIKPNEEPVKLNNRDVKQESENLPDDPVKPLAIDDDNPDITSKEIILPEINAPSLQANSLSDSSSNRKLETPEAKLSENDIKVQSIDGHDKESDTSATNASKESPPNSDVSLEKLPQEPIISDKDFDLDKLSPNGKPNENSITNSDKSATELTLPKLEENKQPITQLPITPQEPALPLQNEATTMQAPEVKPISEQVPQLPVIEELPKAPSAAPTVPLSAATGSKDAAASPTDKSTNEASSVSDKPKPAQVQSNPIPNVAVPEIPTAGSKSPAQEAIPSQGSELKVPVPVESGKSIPASNNPIVEGSNKSVIEPIKKSPVAETVLPLPEPSFKGTKIEEPDTIKHTPITHNKDAKPAVESNKEVPKANAASSKTQEVKFDKFVEDEAVMLQLKDDEDVALGELNEEAQEDLLDFNEYVKKFWQSRKARSQNSNKKKEIEKFIENYDEKFYGYGILPFIENNDSNVVQPLYESDLRAEAINAAQVGDLDSLRVWIDNYPLLNIYDDEGNNLLAIAVINNHSRIVKYLIGKGIDHDNRNKNGETALDIALQNNNRYIIKLLQNIELSKQPSKKGQARPKN
ncbi:MAG: hypothetical protein K0Q51_806 [Rickettsiaceae bacterium]|jgi:ankyrin repeat protein|nr:hypothetical protein [Rickettsiaceae bacterium]